MPKTNETFYVAVLVDVDTRESQVVLCSCMAQLQLLLDNLNEEKYKLSVIEVDDICSFDEWAAEIEKPEKDDTPEWPYNSLN